MRRLLHGVAILGFVAAGILALLGIAAWPPGGLMFALPYFLFFMAGLIAVGSAILFFLTKPAPRAQPDPRHT